MGGKLRTCRGGPWGKRAVALPWIHCRTQLSPSAKLVVSPGQCMWRRAGKGRQGEEETKGVRCSRGNTKISRGGEASFWSRYPRCSPQRTKPDQMDMPDETAASGEPSLEQRKTMRREERNSSVLTNLYSPPWSLNRVGELGVKEWSWAWESWEERCGFIICLFCFN